MRLDDLRGSEIAELIGDHLHSMTFHSPPESIHALDLEKLRQHLNRQNSYMSGLALRIVSLFRITKKIQIVSL